MALPNELHNLLLLSGGVATWSFCLLSRLVSWTCNSSYSERRFWKESFSTEALETCCKEEQRQLNSVEILLTKLSALSSSLHWKLLKFREEGASNHDTAKENQLLSVLEQCLVTCFLAIEVVSQSLEVFAELKKWYAIYYTLLFCSKILDHTINVESIDQELLTLVSEALRSLCPSASFVDCEFWNGSDYSGPALCVQHQALLPSVFLAPTSFELASKKNRSQLYNTSSND